MTDTKISKQGAAKRQLDCAIELFFDNGDTLSIFTLASAVFIITENIHEKHSSPVNRSTVYGQLKTLLTDEEFKEIKLQMGEKPGFLKHANKDHESEINDVSENEALSKLGMATENYIAVFGEQTLPMALIKSYFFLFAGLEKLRQRGLDKDHIEFLMPYKKKFERPNGPNEVKADFLNKIKTGKATGLQAYKL